MFLNEKKNLAFRRNMSEGNKISEGKNMETKIKGNLLSWMKGENNKIFVSLYFYSILEKIVPVNNNVHIYEIVWPDWVKFNAQHKLLNVET